MQRRSFLQALLSTPALAFFRPRSVLPQPSSGPIYSDDSGHADFAALFDDDATTGLDYQP